MTKMNRRTGEIRFCTRGGDGTEGKQVSQAEFAWGPVWGTHMVVMQCPALSVRSATTWDRFNRKATSGTNYLVKYWSDQGVWKSRKKHRLRKLASASWLTGFQHVLWT